MSWFKILLPTTEKQFDTLIQKLMVKYNLPRYDHTAAVVANRIMHLPPDQAKTTERYLAHCVLKNMAYQVAQAKGSKIQHKIQIDAIMAELTVNPLNQQAIDALQKAANDGSDYAKAMLNSFPSVPHPNGTVSNILDLVQPIEAAPGSA